MQVEKYYCPICGGATLLLEYKKKFGSSQRIEFTCQNDKCGTVIIQEYDEKNNEYADRFYINDTKNKENEIWKQYRYQRLNISQWESIKENEYNLESEQKKIVGEKCECCGAYNKPELGFGVIRNKTYCRTCANILISKNIKNILVTTTMNLEGFRITEYIDIESVEIVLGTGLFSEVSSAIDDFFGANSTAFEKKLQNAKKQAFNILKLRAFEKDGNAVVGIDVDYTEFANNRIGLIVNGTIVKIERII